MSRINVQGNGKVASSPDVAFVAFNVVTEGKDSREAATKNGQQVKKVLDVLPDFKIEPENRKTISYQVQPQWTKAKDGEKAEIAGYLATNHVVVRVKNIGIVPDLLGRLTGIGVTNLNFQHGLEDETKQRLEDEARRIALSDARRKAEIYATEGDVRLGSIDDLSEHQRWGGYSGISGAIAPAASRSLESAPPVPVEAGEQEVTITVNVAYNIGSGKRKSKKKK